MSSFFAGPNNSSFDYDQRFGEMARLLEKLIDIQERTLREISELRRDMRDQTRVNGSSSTNW